MEGFQLAARFSIATNRLNFCGPADAEPVLYRAITEGTGREAAEGSLAQFEALYPYLEAIAAKHALTPFDSKVVEAYWIGNDLLDAFDRDDFRRILVALTRRGLPGFVARELDQGLPERPIPHHVFHVGFVGVGSVTGHVETTIPNMEACRPAWAEVHAIDPGHLTVAQPALELREGGLRMGGPRKRVVDYDARMFPTLAVGDSVAVHWGWAATRLEPDQRRNLEEYTRRSLEAANSVHRAPAQ